MQGHIDVCRPRRGKPARRLVFALFTLLLASLATSSEALADGLSGAWRGSGSVDSKGQQRERVACRATYQSGGANSYRAVFSCATRTKGKYSNAVTLRRGKSGRYSGTFVDAKSNALVRVTVRAEGATQKVWVSSSEGHGHIVLHR